MERTVKITPTRQEDCQFLAKPSIVAKKLDYVNATKPVWVNLYKVNLLKDMLMYQYPISFEPEVALINTRVKRAFFGIVEKDVKKIYGECILAGDSIFSATKITELNQLPFTNPRTKIDYILKILPYTNNFYVNESNPYETPYIKQIYELCFKDILHANPFLEFYKNLFVKKDEKKTISTKNHSLDFYPGYGTSLVYTNFGTFLNVTIKNKLLSVYNCLEIINSKRTTTKSGKFTKEEENEIRETFIKRSIKTTYNNKNYVIDEVSFDKTPRTTSFNKDGKTLALANYYQVAHGIKITNLDQPLLMVKKVDSQQQEITLYFIPELCKLAGIDDSAIQDRAFMTDLAQYTKLSPNERVVKTNQFLNLLNEKTTKKIVDNNKKVIGEELSSLQKKTNFKLEILPSEKTNFQANFMAVPTLLGAKGAKVAIDAKKPFGVLNSVDLTNWLCVYHQATFDSANNMLASFKQACKAYNIKVSDPEWVEVNSTKIQDWTGAVDEYMKSENKYQMVVFLLDRTIDKLYKGLKAHSLCNLGYLSQVIKCESLNKNAMSVCSKVLLQMNYKMGGATYKINFGKKIVDHNLMIVGVDSSHIAGSRTGVAMVASINGDFTQYYNKIDIIHEKNKDQLVFCVSAFIKEAINHFYNNNKKTKNPLPGGIVIYRQGVSREQKEFLKSEVFNIEQLLSGTGDENMLKDRNIPYYYILVNTKTAYKFFEKEENKGKTDYFNPTTGLLVMDDVTDPKFFEFYIQPQEVTQGTATPTCYHVAFGNMDCPDLIPKFTFDLCFLYANWQGPVRVPGVLKNAEKLSKMTAKFTRTELHANLRGSLAYL